MTNSASLEQFHQKAKELGLDYLIIGGFAASFWGKPRFTADIDYVIAQHSFELAKKLMSKLGYTLLYIHPKNGFAHFGTEDKSNFRVDFMLVNDKTWRELKESSSTGDFGRSEPFPVVSAKHLIAMKLHAAKQSDREDFVKDLLDVAEIMKAQSISLEDLERDGILAKHGSEETINQLKGILVRRK